MREMLAVALARQIGNALIPDLAKEIVREAASTPDLSIDPVQFALESRGGFAFQCERLIGSGNDLRQQRTSYLYETGAGAPIRTDWGRLIQMSHDGRQAIFTARECESRRLVGSIWLFVGVNVDTGASTVTDDLFYVEREHRGGMLAARLWQYAERSMFAIGVREATFHSRLDNGAERMARFMGYRPTATRVTKTHTGDSFADLPTRHDKE